MAVHEVLGRNVIWWENKNLQKYWTKLSEYIVQKYPEIDNNNPEQIISIFKDCFGYLVNEFESELKAQTNIAFFAFILGLHDSSIEIYKKQLSGELIAPFNDIDFSIYRRILKLILEQSCDIDLIVGVDIRSDLLNFKDEYTEIVQDLMYLGLQIYSFSEQVAHMDLMGPIHGIEIGEDGIMSILTNQPFSFLIDQINEDYVTHNEKVVVDTIGVDEFKLAVESHIGVNYDNASNFLQVQLGNPDAKFDLISYQELKNFTIDHFGYSEEEIETFYSGLVLRRDNKLNVIDSVLNPQRNNRYVYRPILFLHTNLGKRIMVSLDKWSESIVTLTTNAIPWNHAPIEWNANVGFNQYVQEKLRNHDKLLEDEVEKIIQDNSIKFDRNITSLKQIQGDNIRCDIRGVGEIDFIYLDEINHIIYILECKHNRSRFDMVSFRKEYSNFINGYEQRIESKVQWIENNKNIVNEHFGLIYTKDNFNISDYSVIGAFLINAPNFYLYNGNLPCYTLTTFELFIKGEYAQKKYEITMEQENNNFTFLLERPYFTNTLNALNERRLGRM